MPANKKGDRYERKLVNALTEDGWFAQRAAASGGGGDHELPDVIAAKNGRIEVIELKYIASPPAYVSPEKVEGLVWLANHLEGTPRLSLRMKGDTSYYCVHPQHVRQTEEAENYVLDDSILTDAIVIAEA